MTPWEGKVLPLGRGPQGAGHRWQAWAASSPWSAVRQPQVFGPGGLKELIPPNPSRPGVCGGTIERPRETLFVLPGLQAPRAVCSSPQAMFRLGQGAGTCEGQLRSTDLPHRSTILSV